MKNYYAILGIQRNATEDQIKTGYRRAAKLAHPDKNVSDPKTQAAAEALMKDVGEAYATLSDPEKRRSYDLLVESDDVFSESRMPVLGYITKGPTPARSYYFKRDHAKLVAEYTQTPLSKGSVRSNFKTLNASIYTLQKNGGKQTSHPDIFSLINAKSSGGFLLPYINDAFIQRTLTPAIAIKILTDFLSGQYYGFNVGIISSYLRNQIKKAKSAQEIDPAILLYEGIYGLFLRAEGRAPLQIQNNLLSAVEKITSYAAKMDGSISYQFIMLLQGKYFRHLFSQALHEHWQSPVSVFINHSNFDGQEVLKKLLDGFREKLLGSNTEGLRGRIQYVRMLSRFDNAVNSKFNMQNISFFYRKNAFIILDWLDAIGFRSSRHIFINTIIQAAIQFQLSAFKGKIPAQQMADEKLAYSLYVDAIIKAESATPNVQLYTLIHCLKYMSAFQFQTPELVKVIPLIQKRVLKIIDVFPFFEPAQSNAQLFDDSFSMIILMREVLQTLVRIIKNNKIETAGNLVKLDVPEAAVLYQAYAACLRGWYEDHTNLDSENEIRLALMQELLTLKGWDFPGMGKNLESPWIMIDRDTAGWIKPRPTLTFPADPALTAFQSLNGFMINETTGEITFVITEADANTLPYRKVLTMADIVEMVEAQIFGAFFSLDPPDPDMHLHPFNQMRYGPPALRDTQLFTTMMLADYLLKFFTIGNEVKGIYPYDMRSADQLLDQIPEYLRVIIHNFRNTKTSEEAIHRFWFEAIEVPTVYKKKEDKTLLFTFGDAKVVVKKHLMGRDAEGKLIDIPEPDEGWHIYAFPANKKAAFNKNQLDITRPAMIFFENQNDVILLDDNDAPSLTLTLPEYNNKVSVVNYKERRNVLFKQPKDAKGEIRRTTNNVSLVYATITEIAALAKREHHFSPEFVFAQEFSDHYEEFSQYFPELQRLKEMARVVAIVNKLLAIRKGNKEQISDFEKVLADIDYWNNAKKNASIWGGSAKREYSSKYNEDYPKVRENIRDNFARWGASTSQYLFTQEYISKLGEIYDKIKPLSFDQYSTEVQQDCQACFEQNKERITREHGYEAWNHNESRIRKEIFDDAPRVAREMSETKWNGIYKAMYDAHSPMLPGDSAKYLIETFMKGNSGPLAEALGTHRFYEEISQISRIFPGHSTIILDSALRGNNEALDTIAHQRMYDEICAVLPALRNLEYKFQNMGMGKRADRKPPETTCDWIPASIRRAQKEGTEFVYGGVELSPHPVQVDNAHGRADDMIFNTFFAGKKAAVPAAEIQRNTGLPEKLPHLRELHAMAVRLAEAQAKGADVDALIAEAKRRADAKTAAPRPAQASAAASTITVAKPSTATSVPVKPAAAATPKAPAAASSAPGMPSTAASSVPVRPTATKAAVPKTAMPAATTPSAVRPPPAAASTAPARPAPAAQASIPTPPPVAAAAGGSSSGGGKKPPGSGGRGGRSRSPSPPPPGAGSASASSAKVKASTHIKGTAKFTTDATNLPRKTQKAIDEGWEVPYGGKFVREFITAEEIKFLRFYSVDSRKIGGFLIREKEVRNIMHDPEALKTHLGLAEIPVYFCEVFVPTDTRMRVGIIGPQPTHGRDFSGGFQYELIDRIPTECYKQNNLILKQTQDESCVPS